MSWIVDCSDIFKILPFSIYITLYIKILSNLHIEPFVGFRNIHYEKYSAHRYERMRYNDCIIQ